MVMFFFGVKHSCMEPIGLPHTKACSFESFVYVCHLIERPMNSDLEIVNTEKFQYHQ
jgi:hypothetical protein